MATRYVDQECGTAIPGTSVTLTNASTAVVGDGTDFTSPSINGKHIKLTADTGEKWALVASVEDATHATLSANYTGAGGTDPAKQTANSGASTADAWITIRSAFTYGSYGSNDITRVRRAQTHAIATTDVAAAYNGGTGAPITIMGDDGTAWAGEGGLARPICTFTGVIIYWSNKSGWVVSNLDFQRNGGPTVDGYGSIVGFVNCRFYELGTVTSEGCLSRCAFCTFDSCQFVVTTAGLYYGPIGGSSCGRFKNCTYDGGKVTFYGPAAALFIENGTIGGTTPPTNVFSIGGNQRVWFRNVALTYTGVLAVFEPAGELFFEDYDGVKGDWYAQDRYRSLQNLAATSTGSGAKKYTDTVIKALATALVSSNHPALIAEFPVYVGTTGTKTITCWTQPDGWDPSPPDTQGADAILWAEVAAWDTATSAYLYFDSRNKAAQNAQVEDQWHDIVVENVAVDATGWIIVRIYWGGLGNGAKIIYVDMAPQVT